MSIPPPLPPTPISYEGQRMCPGCGGGPLYSPTFTWWGGAIGHKMLGVERCTICRKWWVKKTGLPGNTRVNIYTIAGIALGLIALLLYLAINFLR